MIMHCILLLYLTFVIFYAIQKSVQTQYLRDGDKWRFWGAYWQIPPHFCHCRGAGDRRTFVLHVVYPITEGLNGISCRDRDIKSFVCDCFSSEKPASRQTALSQLLGPLPNLWHPREWGKRWRGIEEGRSKKKCGKALFLLCQEAWELYAKLIKISNQSFVCEICHWGGLSRFDCLTNINMSSV